MSESSGNGSEIDKGKLFGEWLRGEQWERRLKSKLVHKSLDIAEGEDVNLSVNNSTGISTTGAIGVALAAGLPAALLGLALLFKGGGTPAPATYPGPPDSNYTIRFYDKDGKLIDVPHISQKPKQ